MSLPLPSSSSGCAERRGPWCIAMQPKQCPPGMMCPAVMVHVATLERSRKDGGTVVLSATSRDQLNMLIDQWEEKNRKQEPAPNQTIKPTTAPNGITQTIEQNRDEPLPPAQNGGKLPKWALPVGAAAALVLLMR